MQEMERQRRQNEKLSEIEQVCLPLRKGSGCNKLEKGCHKHDFSSKELELIMLGQFWQICTYD